MIAEFGHGLPQAQLPLEQEHQREFHRLSVIYWDETTRQAYNQGWEEAKAQAATLEKQPNAAVLNAALIISAGQRALSMIGLGSTPGIHALKTFADCEATIVLRTAYGGNKRQIQKARRQAEQIAAAIRPCP